MSFFLRFVWICFIFWVLSPVLPSLALKPRLRGRRFVLRVLIELVVGDGVLAVLMLILSLVHLVGPLSLFLAVVIAYTAMALWAYRRRPWIIFTQFTKYSRRILLGIVGWKTIFHNIGRRFHDRMFLPDSFGDRVFRKHKVQWILTLGVFLASAGIYYLRQSRVYGFTDPFEKEVLEHCVQVFLFHPFRGNAASLLPALLCGGTAYISHIEAYAVIRTFLFLSAMQAAAALTAVLMLLSRHLRFLPVLVSGVLGVVFLSFFPQQNMELPDNTTAETMLRVRRNNADHTWTMIAVDDSLGIARGYATYYSAEDLFSDMGEEDGGDADKPGSSDLLTERDGDIFLDTDKIYVCVDHMIPSDDSVQRTGYRTLSAQLDEWVRSVETVYPQNVQMLEDNADCSLFLIRQEQNAPLNLSVNGAWKEAD